jgi:glutamate/tyrosine decarboxylase-like PLP-dependent enzyme
MLQLPKEEREILWRRVFAELESYFETVGRLPVAPELDPGRIRQSLEGFDFSRGLAPLDAVSAAVQGLIHDQVHTPHPRYFGLFNPAPTTMGIVGDTLAAAFNPQIAAWSHSPWAAEVEARLVREFGVKFGYPASQVDGTFTTGGMEANHTAVLCALTDAFPDYAIGGVRALEKQPAIYVSAESHHSLLKSARLCGIGMNSVRQIPVDGNLRMRVDALSAAIARDRLEGMAPCLIVATAGTTNAGVIDPLPEIAAAADAGRIWLHVDAAWGGAAALVPEMRHLLNGIERSRSITFDAHKWLSVPMAAGLYLTRDRTVMERTFQVQTAYMPKEGEGLDIIDPHLHTMQWSRRFTGLKVFLSMLVAGWDGYAEAIRQQTQMGQLLRRRLRESGWELANDTPLPVVCFVDPAGGDDQQKRIARAVVASGAAWISTTVLGGRRTVLRACITNYRTGPADVEALLVTLENARSQ